MMVMKTPCHACGQMGESRMCLTDIPYFKVSVFQSLHGRKSSSCPLFAITVASAPMRFIFQSCVMSRSREEAAFPSRVNAPFSEQMSNTSWRTCVVMC